MKIVHDERKLGTPGILDTLRGMRTRNQAAVLLALLLVACGFPKAGPVPGPVTADNASAASARWQGTTRESLERGRTTFAAKCNACHSHPDVRAIPEAKWPEILDSMAKKADLSPAQKEEVLHFILTARAEPAPHG